MGMVQSLLSMTDDRILTRLKEHVPRSSALLPTPLPLEPMDSEPLPSRRDIGLDCHELGLDASPDKDAEERFISQKNIDITHHQYRGLCYIVSIDVD